MSIRTLLVLFLLSAVGLAAENGSVGKLTAREGVRLDGVTLPAEGIPSWPVSIGSTVETGQYPAVILINGQRHVVAPSSTAVVEADDAGEPTVRLLGEPLGSAVSGSDVSVLAAADSQGSQSAGGRRLRALAGQNLPGVQGVDEVSPIDDSDPDDLSEDPTPSDCPAFVALLPPQFRFCNPDE